ncbi:MAG: mOMP-like family protein [Parachlamydiales bacterium]|nr:mOMP-like family protein [Parachlamydiales bacterium]
MSTRLNSLLEAQSRLFRGGLAELFILSGAFKRPPFFNLSLAAICLSALSLHAMPPSCRPLNSFEQGHELRQNQMMAAYNATARVDVRGSWDLYFTGSYIFWQPREENLELGILNDGASTIALPIDGRVINMNFQYKSGFKTGMGIFTDWDNWDAYVEYTWLTGHHRSRATAATGHCILPFWGHPANVSPTTIYSAKSRWNLELNIIDAQLARSYYVGTKLTFRPFFAGRAAWINQSYTAAYTQTGALTYAIRNSSHSWGVGPEAGLTTHWLLGYGVRLIGTAEADVLFTRYNLRYQEENSTTPSTNAVSFHQRHVMYLRPHTNLEFGLGWGSYFCNHNYHFDILGTYGFQVFWNQNMFRNFVDNVSVGKSYVPGGDLYIHGATGELRFDF